jgi:translation initiation factor 1
MGDDPRPFHNPFGSLADLGGRPRDARQTEFAAASGPGADARGAIPRAVVRLERAGRRGKDVTIVTHLALPAADRDRWLKDLKGALGCGGTVEGADLVLQGDHRTRLPALLASRGVRKVTVG